MKVKIYSCLLTLLVTILVGSPIYAQSIIPESPYDFPFGYPFPEYPLAGASHPSLSNDYMSDPTFDGDIKRVAQYALRLVQTERDDSYDLYEFQSSQFTNIHTHPVMDGSLFGYNEKNSFGLVHFNTNAEDPEVTYKIVNIDGKLLHSFTVKLSELTN